MDAVRPDPDLATMVHCDSSVGLRKEYVGVMIREEIDCVNGRWRLHCPLRNEKDDLRLEMIVCKRTDPFPTVMSGGGAEEYSCMMPSPSSLLMSG